MNLNFDTTYYSYDTTPLKFDATNDGITHDDGGGYTFDWEEQTIHTVDSDTIPESYTAFFDTDSFYAIDATVAQPIEQRYYIDGDWYTFYKPEDELRKSAWSLDNAPYTLTHPEGGSIQSATDVRGFWKNKGYDDGLNARLYIPTNDDESKAFISDHDNVSVGFINTLVRSERDGVDADQTGIVYDHVASVKRGRCSDEEGCGLSGFSDFNDNGDDDHSDQQYVSASAIPTANRQKHQQGMGGYVGTNTDADTTITTVTDTVTDTTNTTRDTTMQCNDCGNSMDGLFDVDDLSVRKVRSENDAVDDELTAKEDEITDLKSELNDVSDAQDLLGTIAETVTDDADAADGEGVLDAITDLQDHAEALKDEVNTYMADERDELLSDVKSLTDADDLSKFDQRDDETVTEHISRLEDSLETMEMVSGETTPNTVTTRQSKTTDSGETKTKFPSERGAEVDMSEVGSFDNF